MRATTVIDVAPAQGRTTTCPPPESRRLLVVCSHPFDVTHALGGVIAAFAAAGTVVQIVCLTHEPGPDPERRRRPGDAAELLQATRLLGAREAVLLDHGAAHLQWNPPETLACELRSVAGPVDAVLTVDARAPGAHPDLVRAMRAARRVGARLHCPVYGWVPGPEAAAAADVPPLLAGRADGMIPVDCDRARQRAAIACQGAPGAEDPVLSLSGADRPRDLLTVL
ncbi:PIG-L deacetylase family protein [Promicromonospora sp. MS192]|uniref:PIG-L deacetylase family protein n=1 Tax=Promicromonospora sp. MS192 TaxID=3412684 RepID=UPI003C2DFA67